MSIKKYSSGTNAFPHKGKMEDFEAKIEIGTKQQFSFKNNRKQVQRTIYTQGVIGSAYHSLNFS